VNTTEYSFQSAFRVVDPPSLTGDNREIPLIPFTSYAVNPSSLIGDSCKSPSRSASPSTLTGSSYNIFLFFLSLSPLLPFFQIYPFILFDILIAITFTINQHSTIVLLLQFFIQN